MSKHFVPFCERGLIPAVIGNIVAVIILAWNLDAIGTDRAPDHILPVVRFLSGTAHMVPVAYQWTIELTVFCFLAIAACSGFLIVAGTFLLWSRRKIATRP